MSGDAPPPKKPGKISRFFSRLVAIPRSWSVAGRSAVLLALFLVIAAVTVWLIVLFRPSSVPWRHSMTVGHFLAVIGLMIVSPFVFYHAIRLWVEGERSQFPDLEYAWKAGLEALQRNGLSLDSIPVFLILGSSGERQERALLNAAGMGLRVRGVPEGPAPLHWYANSERIYIFTTEASWLSGLAKLVEKRIAKNVATTVANPEAPAAAAPGPADSGMGTLRLDQFVTPPQAHAPVGGAPGGDSRKTISLDEFMVAQQPAGAAKAPPGRVLGNLSPAASPAWPAGGRPAPAPAMAIEADSPSDSAIFASVSLAATDDPVVLAPQDSAVQLQRLQYFCQLLRLARQPLCGTNGILALLPFELIQAGARESEELQNAVKADLTTAQRALQLNCPVTALVVGLERERGFSELVRRVGRERAAAQRFGRRFDIRSLPVPAELAALCTHVCGAFEDWVYTLFRENGALTRPGNTRLYGLLCKVRSHLKGRLTDLLANSFGYEMKGTGYEDPLAFSGCYFAATGDSEDRQAFVKGVLDKLDEEQEEVEWTRAAIASDRRHLWLAYGAFFLNVVLALTLLGMILYRRLYS
jgi:hypothetical protein